MKIYDDIFRTLSEKNTKLLIPVINVIFSTHYKMTDKLDLMSGEHHILPDADSEDTGEIITDSCIRIGNKLYHIECQSTPDGSMVVRMIEYDFHIALERAVKLDGAYEMEFPQSAVLYLRHNEDTPDFIKMIIKFPNGDRVTYQVPIFKTQTFSADEVLAKELYFIIPYYILRYEKLSEGIDHEALVREYQKLYNGMKEALDNKVLDEYDMTNIIEYTERLVNYVFKDDEDVRKEVTGIMGGQVLETYADKMITKGRLDGMREGKREGLREGELKGKREGLREGEQIANMNVAKRMIFMNMSSEDISKVTGLSMDEIEELRDSCQ